MTLAFVNRDAEQRELDEAAAHGGLLVVFGRRRVGKSRLLWHWLERHDGLYTQAIEAPQDLQLQQVFRDLAPRLSTAIEPKTWSELFELLALQKRKWVLCIDEFPYLTAVDPSLPSRLQAFLDRGLPGGCLLILAGSSMRMMHDMFLSRAAPLYGRARKLLHVQPMDYAAFCGACRLPREEIASFEKFACVGGIPKYWEFVGRGQDQLALCDALYFGFAPFMEQEPQRLLRDECISGINAVATLEAIGRGAERPSEVAARLNTAQTNLSRVLQQLLDASLIVRDLPFGESMRSTKKVLYRIQDPAVRFWFRVYSPHQTRWRSYARAEKTKLVRDHAATVFEDVSRARFPGAQRYWEPGVEFDLVAPDPDHAKGLLVGEVKWQRLTKAQRAAVLRDLTARWQTCALAARHPAVRFAVFDAGVLAD